MEEQKYIPAYNEPKSLGFWKSLGSKISVKTIGFFYRLIDSKKKYIVRGIKPVGAPTYDPIEGCMVVDEANPEALNAFVKPSSEIIEPEPQDTIESLCEKMSQAAIDREFGRVIVYPIENPIRQDIMILLESEEGKLKYPMLEYLPASIVNKDDLNSKTIIYKHSGKVHYCKPI